MDDVSGLIARIEGGAFGPEVDAEVARAFGLRVSEDDRWLVTHDRSADLLTWVPRYTTSLDAAVTLYRVVPDLVPPDPRAIVVRALRSLGGG